LSYGPRFAPGGYQAPSTDAVALRRGAPLRSQAWTFGQDRTVQLALVPLEGGRPELYELALTVHERARAHTTYVPCMVRGQDTARAAWARTAERLDAGEIPDRVLLPADARLGW